MAQTVEEIAEKMDALGLWDKLQPYNWAVKPQGTAFPYFCSLLKSSADAKVKVRLLMLEGWQTMHDYVRVRIDNNYGFCSEPSELPHFELIITTEGKIVLYRYDPLFVPTEATEAQRALVAKILWESYGVMMRVEMDSQLAISFADQKAVFARVEKADGTWCDEPLVIPDARAHVEQVSIPKDILKMAKDLPFDEHWSVAVDFHMLKQRAIQGPRPRTLYELKVIDMTTRKPIFGMHLAPTVDGGLRQLWETMPVHLLAGFMNVKRMAGEVHVRSGRVFRFLRVLCVDVPFKLALHDQLPILDEVQTPQPPAQP